MKFTTKDLKGLGMSMKMFLFAVLLVGSFLQAQDQRWSDLKSGDISLTEDFLIDVTEMKEIKIHEGGRVKPLDTYARNTLLILNGKSTFEGKEAIAWLARLMFDPEKTLDDRIFKINHNDILYALGIQPSKTRRYTYNELLRASGKLFQVAELALSRDDKERSAADKEFIRIYNNFGLANVLMNDFLFALPVVTFQLPDKDAKNILGLDENLEYFSYLDIMEVSDQLRVEVDKIEAKNKDSWTATDVFIWELNKKYQPFISQIQSSSILFLPSYTNGEERWFNFSQVLQVAGGKNIINHEIKNVNEMVKAYRAGDQVAFDKNVKEYKDNIDKKMKETNANFTTQAEIIYNKLDPFYRASILYGFAFILLLVFLALQKPWLKKVAMMLTLIGGGIQLTGMILRFLITFRPPITNLFETFIFVGMVAVIFGFLMERFNRQGIGILVGAFSGLAMILISNRFASEGDTMAVLVAVLRSNFWLSTHVVTINLGYAGVVISGVIGHVYLFYRMKDTDPNKLKSISRLVYATQAFGIIFTFIGTVLGGVWADQSWGRFWGWDPKENGSLLIVLWSAILFHARLGGMIKDLGFSAGSIVGIVVLSLAWFGINLLGVGLHSYGFVSGIAAALFTYIGIQFIILFSCLFYIEYRQQKIKLN